MKTRTIVACVLAGCSLLAASGLATLIGYTRSHCSAAEYADIGAPVSDATKYFSPDYQTAREKLLSSGRLAGALLEHIKHPIPGPDGEALYTDVAILGEAKAKRLLVIISGTHGVEGFAGSALQVGLLLSGVSELLPADTALIMIHAINPYGMAYMRRFNEDNIDLNRNFLDHQLPPPENPGYEKLARHIAPESMSFMSEFVSLTSLALFRLNAGPVETKIAISGGQFTHPRGLFYGGGSDVWSNTTLRRLLTRYLDGAQQVVAIDVHTALGPFSKATLLPSIDPASAEHRRAKAIWDARFFRESQAGHPPNRHLDATVKSAIERMNPGKDITAVTLEFGTFPSIDVFLALRTENWLHHHGEDDEPRLNAIKTCLMRTYYPDSESWMSSVWREGEVIVKQALAHLADSEDASGDMHVE